MNGNNIIKNDEVNQVIDQLICRWFNESEYEGKLLQNYYIGQLDRALNEHVEFGKFAVATASAQGNTQLTFRCKCTENIVHNNVECDKIFDLRIKYTDSGFDMDFITYNK